MTNDANKIEVIVEVSPQTNQMVEAEMTGETDDLKHETKALIEAIKRRAQSEALEAGTITRDTYINAVRRAREAIEGEKLIERDRIENSFHALQSEVEKNFQTIVEEIATLSDRIQDATKAAWDAFTAPRPRL